MELDGTELLRQPSLKRRQVVESAERLAKELEEPELIDGEYLGIALAFGSFAGCVGVCRASLNDLMWGGEYYQPILSIYKDALLKFEALVELNPTWTNRKHLENVRKEVDELPHRPQYRQR